MRLPRTANVKIKDFTFFELILPGWCQDDGVSSLQGQDDARMMPPPRVFPHASHSRGRMMPGWPQTNKKNAKRGHTVAHQWESMQIHGNQWKSKKTHGNRWKAPQITENVWKSLKSNQNQWESRKSNANLWKAMQIPENQYKSIKSNKKQCKSIKISENN